MRVIDEIMKSASDGVLTLRPVVITDWRDGPIEGITRLSVGDELWLFRLFAESVGSDDLDDRLFLLHRLSKEVVDAGIARWIADWPLVWPFDDHPESDAITSAVDLAFGSDPPAVLMVNSTDFKEVLKAWMVRHEPS